MKSIIKVKNGSKLMVCAFMLLCLFSNLNIQSQTTTTNNKEFYRSPYSTRNSGSYGKGQHLLSIAYGVPNLLYFGTGLTNSIVYGSSRHIGIGPLMLKYEFPVRDEVGVGVILQGAVKSWKYTDSGHSYKDHAWGTGVAFMGYYHFNKLINIEKMDVYAGVGVCFSYQQLTTDRSYYNYYYNSYGYYNSSQVQSDFTIRPCGVLGIRYYVTPKFAFSAEAGYTAFSSLNLGVTFRL